MKVEKDSMERKVEELNVLLTASATAHEATMKQLELAKFFLQVR